MKRIELDLGGGFKLVVDPSVAPEFREVYVGIEKDGELWQDLAWIGQNCYGDARGNIHLIPNEFFVKVFANENREEWTDEFIIKKYKEVEK